MAPVLLTFLILVCAIQAVRVRSLLTAALWLAGMSAFTAMLLFSLSAYRVAVIELSVGGGLVTVLLVFAITMTGTQAGGESSSVPRLLALGLAVLPAILLGILAIWPLARIDPVVNPTAALPRDLDMLLQVELIFAGGLTVLGLLPNTEKAASTNAEIDLGDALTSASTEPEEKEVV